MSLRSAVVRQFKQPRGLPGRLAGLIMASRSSNRRRNAWTVNLLDLEPAHRVLEIGCGPGLALKACVARTGQGMVVGLDHSPLMVEQARHRLKEEIRVGRAEVRLGTLADAAHQPESFDRVFSANVVQFFADLNEEFARFRDCLAAGGRVATTYQPRTKNPTREQALEMAARIEAAMKNAGFECIERHELPLAPVPSVCVVGVKV